MLVQGDLIRAENEAQQQSRRFLHSDPQWSWKFKTLQAEAMLWRGLYEKALTILNSQPIPYTQPDLAVHTLTLVGVAQIYLRDFPEATKNIEQAQSLCPSAPAGCGEVLGARGLLAIERGDSSSAEKFLTECLSLAREHGDRYLESKALRNLGAISLTKEHYDEAIDRSQASYEAAEAVGAKAVQLVAKANIGWADYKLGNRERALLEFREAAERASELGNIFEQENDLTNAGYVYMDQGESGPAAQAFQQALALAETTNAKRHIYNALRVLARLSLQTDQLDKAVEYSNRALQVARESGIHADELYPRLVQGQIAARRGSTEEAQRTFLEVESDPACPVFLKWEAEHSLARLLENGNQSQRAESYYRKALATFEEARASVRRQSSQLSFLTNGWRIYDDYLHFLVEHGRTDDALRWADYSRARTLAEGLGILPVSSAQPPPLAPQKIARAVDGTILFYWLGETQSYLWATSPQRTRFFTLPPGPEIDGVARRYREAMTGPQSVSAPTNPDGQWLYRTLVAPADALLAGNSRVFVIPDGNLNNLNFDTLISPTSQPHYWIEDATIVNASSLRVLAASDGAVRQRKNLLLIGDSIAPNPRYPELPKAAAQVQAVAAHFPTKQERVITGDKATPEAYLDAKPEQYSYIHFVAHGTASRLSPLDSAIILSKSSGADDSFKLYARDIMRHPLRAELVTISACYGAGTRSYSGEGLVGLSWAFLRSGAHNVIAALWEASDTPTERLMAKFYDELNRGANPSTALRTAKLSLLHESAFSSPFYWAPFQLYTQGRSGSSNQAAARAANLRTAIATNGSP